MAGRRLESIDDFNKALRDKYGIGEGANYKPWLRAQDVKSKGVRSQISGLKVDRIHHTQSSIETEFFYLAEFCNSVFDIREQFPLLPIDLSIKISKALGISHPSHPETKCPIVITTDFLLSRRIGSDVVYEAVSVKPSNKTVQKRALEKIEISRVWWELLGIKFSHFVGNKRTQIQSRNINWATHPLRGNIEEFSLPLLEQALYLIQPGILIKKELCERFISELGVEHDQALNLLRSLIALKHITVDLTIPLEDSDLIEIFAVNQIGLESVYGNS